MKIKTTFLLLVLCCWATLNSWAGSDAKYLDNFKSIPVLQEGRIKPVDTYARNLLLQFSGKDHVEKTSAVTWFAKLLFVPQDTFGDKVLLINNPEIAVALNIKPEEHRRYSYQQLQPVFAKLQELKQGAESIDEHERSLAENEIIRVAQNVELYMAFTNEFAWSFPNEDFTIRDAALKKQLGLPAGSQMFSYIDMALIADKLKDLTIALKAKDPASMSASQQELLAAVNNMFRWSQSNKDLPMAAVPLGKDWVSPWEALAGNFSDEPTRKLVMLWHQMALAYVKGDLMEFDISAHEYNDALQGVLSDHDRNIIHKFPLELTYHAAMPFLWARIFYILAFIFFIISFASSRRLWYVLGSLSILAGFIPHTFGMIARIIIMNRPPVTNLYETFIFVGFITVLLGLGIEYFNRRWLGLMTAGICGTILLFIAGKYSAEGDTLKMLVAVLNSNFWLGTHVTTITMGYGATCVAGILGHIWLLQAVLKKDQSVLDDTYKTTLGIMGVALTLTFLGTNLGGIWADQSWGRFWGWDPKENGALMIVLWLAILFHAKFAGMIDPVGLAVGCVLGMMIVMWAWFGVNLLSIGLHSYGFTSGIANTLIIYAVCEILFITFTCLFIRKL